MANESKDQPVLGHIDGLVKEEERLYAQRELTDEDRGRLAKIKVELDQCWDLLRQRRALREFGRDPDQAKGAPAEGRRKLRTVVPARRSVCSTKVGAAVYARRKCMVEPVFGQIKQARGFRQFLMRGLEKVRGEWAMICMTHDLLKFHKICYG